MKFKSLMALLVVFTMIMTSMVCSAAIQVTTTAQYGSTSATYSGLKVTTQVRNAAPGSMIAYAIYATGNRNADGSMSQSPESNITVAQDGSTNLVYIDQATVSDAGTATFETQPYTGAYDKMAGAKVKLGSSDTADQAVLAGTNTTVINETNTCYAIVAPAEAGWNAAQIASIDVEVTSDGINYSGSITAADGKVYIPVGSAIKITLVPKSGYKLADGGYKLGETDMSITSANAIYTAKPNATQDAQLPLTLAAGVASTPDEYLTLDAEPIFADNSITYCMTNNTNAKAGIDVTITSKADDSVKLVLNDLDMVNFADGATLSGYCGIQILNELKSTDPLYDFATNSAAYKYEVTPYYYDGGTKKPLTKNGDYYTK